MRQEEQGLVRLRALTSSRMSPGFEIRSLDGIVCGATRGGCQLNTAPTGARLSAGVVHRRAPVVAPRLDVSPSLDEALQNLFLSAVFAWQQKKRRFSVVIAPPPAADTHTGSGWPHLNAAWCMSVQPSLFTEPRSLGSSFRLSAAVGKGTKDFTGLSAPEGPSCVNEQKERCVWTAGRAVKESRADGGTPIDERR